MLGAGPAGAQGAAGTQNPSQYTSQELDLEDQPGSRSRMVSWTPGHDLTLASQGSAMLVQEAGPTGAERMAGSARVTASGTTEQAIPGPSPWTAYLTEWDAGSPGWSNN